MLEKIVLASNNLGKLRELSAVLEPLGVHLIPQAELGVSECSEPYMTFLENALAKARHACAQTGLPALADDSGLCVETLRGAPGVMSARFAGEPCCDKKNNSLLIERLHGKAERRAWYTCSLIFLRHEQDPQPIVAQGVWYGRIIDHARGEGGFGYDPHFWLDDYGMTVAELAPEVKSKISHRGLAVQSLLAQLKAFQ